MPPTGGRLIERRNVVPCEACVTLLLDQTPANNDIAIKNAIDKNRHVPPAAIIEKTILALDGG
jgi:hypothetical protein